MHHYTWQWSPTVETLLILLGVFLLCSVALLLSTYLSNRQRHTRRVIHTPRGKVELKRMSKRGLERARSRQYHIKGRE